MIERENLILVIRILFSLLVCLWFFIALSILLRKRGTRKKKAIEKVFSKVVSEYLYPDSEEKTNLITIQRKLRRAGITKAQPQNVQHLIDLMIRTQRTLLGNNYNKLQILFKQIPPYRASLTKLYSKKWHIKARGIREIYEMDQYQHARYIIKERNNANLYVRREAQIAIVVFLGWESLRFLPYLKKEMTLWQQIKVVEKLYALYPEPHLGRLRKAYRTKKPYAQELIMRIIRKFKISSELDYIIGFLAHPDFERREAAIYCISTFDLEPERLERVKESFFEIPNTHQKMQLLKHLQRWDMKDILFYKKVLNIDNDILKLATAEFLWNNGYQEEVQEYYYQQYTGETEAVETL